MKRRDLIRHNMNGKLSSPTNSQCPKCQSPVADNLNQCPDCGEFFPNLQQRQGNVAGGALCGLVRGIGMVAAMVAGGGLLGWLSPPHAFGHLVAAVVGAILFGLSLPIASRLHSATYHVEE